MAATVIPLLTEVNDVDRRAVYSFQFAHHVNEQRVNQLRNASDEALTSSISNEAYVLLVDGVPGEGVIETSRREWR